MSNITTVSLSAQWQLLDYLQNTFANSLKIRYGCLLR